MPKSEEKSDTHLRSTKEVFRYRAEAIDAEFGKVEDFMIDSSTWLIRYLVIDLKKWLPRGPYIKGMGRIYYLNAMDLRSWSGILIFAAVVSLRTLL
jgi:hypothetical protein